MEPSRPALKRVVGRWQIVGLALNDVVGSGVYLLPAAAALALGAFSVWAVLLAGLAVLLLVLCFAEASSYFDQPGSAYLYARAAFGEVVGFEVGWMTWLARIAAGASLTAGFAQALGYLWPAVDVGWARALLITLVLAVLTVLNVVGVRTGVGTAVALVVTKMVPLLVFVGAGIFAVSRETIAGQPVGQGNLGQAALLLLFAYAGFENTPASAGEYKNPRRDVPFALVVHIAIVTLLYVGVQWVALGTLPNLGGSPTPLADSATLFLGSWAGLLLTVGAAVSILGTTSNTVLAGPRYLLALARDGFGPRFLARVHPRYRTPAAAIVTQTAISLPLALSGTFATLATLSVMARLITYLGTAAAVPVLRGKYPDVPGTIRLPGGAAIPAAAVLLTLGLAASATLNELIAATIGLAVGLMLYLVRREPEPPAS
jgi:amino acid transporter